MTGRLQLTSGGHRPYLEAVEGAFGMDGITRSFRSYGADPKNEKRYSPAKCIGVDCTTIAGNPNPKHISTSYVERHQNLTIADAHAPVHTAYECL